MDIEARLEYIIFENKANHYVVAGFSELKTYHNFTAAGRIEDPIEDQEYVLQGEYVKHPKYRGAVSCGYGQKEIARQFGCDHSFSLW